MQRIFGALAIFGGWLCILLSAVFGLVASQFLGLDHFEGNPPPAGLYGVPAVVVLWIAVTAAIVSAVPAASAMFAPDPSRRLYAAATVMGVIGVAMLPDDLGRAYAAAIIPGAALFAAGAWWTHRAGPIGAEAGSGSTGAGATEPWAGPAPDPAGSGRVAGISPEPSPETRVKRSSGRAAKSQAKPKIEAETECPWCSARIVAGAERCPSCGAALISAPETAVVAIPGVTAITPELREYQYRVAHQKKRPGLISMVLGEFGDKSAGSPAQDVDVAAFQPPSDEVRAEMARLDREIDAARVVPEDISVPEAAAPEVAAAPGPEVAAAPVPAAAPEAPTPAPEAGSADDRHPSSDA
jgi:hypothetical protein